MNQAGRGGGGGRLLGAQSSSWDEAGVSPARNGGDGIAARLEQLLGEGRKPGAVERGNLRLSPCLIRHQTCFSALISFFSSPNFPSPGDLALGKFLELKRGCIYFSGSVVSSQPLTGGDGAAS